MYGPEQTLTGASSSASSEGLWDTARCGWGCRCRFRRQRWLDGGSAASSDREPSSTSLTQEIPGIHYLAVAKRLGIATGIGDNCTRGADISRQDMFTLLYGPGSSGRSPAQTVGAA
jgi:hypothetical protein